MDAPPCAMLTSSRPNSVATKCPHLSVGSTPTALDQLHPATHNGGLLDFLVALWCVHCSTVSLKNLSSPELLLLNLVIKGKQLVHNLDDFLN